MSVHISNCAILVCRRCQYMADWVVYFYYYILFSQRPSDTGTIMYLYFGDEEVTLMNLPRILARILPKVPSRLWFTNGQWCSMETKCAAQSSKTAVWGTYLVPTPPILMSLNGKPWEVVPFSPQALNQELLTSEEQNAQLLQSFIDVYLSLQGIS